MALNQIGLSSEMSEMPMDSNESEASQPPDMLEGALHHIFNSRKGQRFSDALGNVLHQRRNQDWVPIKGVGSQGVVSIWIM